MNLLALEFSSKRRSIAILNAQTGAFLADIADENFHEVTPMMLVDQALQTAGITPADVHRIALGIGPGSYTGVRSSIAIAQGWELARGIEVAAVPSLDVAAREAFNHGLRGEVEIIADAQRKELYSQTIDIADGGTISLKQPLAIKSPATVASARVVIGPEAARLVPHARDLYPTATALAQMAAANARCCVPPA